MAKKESEMMLLRGEDEDGDIGEDEKKLQKELAMIEGGKKGNNSDLMREAGIGQIGAANGMPSHMLTGGPSAYGGSSYMGAGGSPYDYNML